MSFKLAMTTGPMPHPPFTYETMEGMRSAVLNALDKGFYRRTEFDPMLPGEENALIYQLGPGTVFKLMSDERYKEMVAEKQTQMSRMASGLIVPAQARQGAYKLVINVAGGQLDPFEYDSREDAAEAAETAIEKGWLEYVENAESDITFLQTGPGTLWMTMSTEHYDMQRRRAVQGAMQAAQQQRQQGGSSGIILPGATPKKH